MRKKDVSLEIPERGGRTVLGVHLDIDALRVVEVHHGKIIDWINVPYPSGLHLDSETFPSFLKQSMADFHSLSRHAALWVTGPTPSLQVRFISLPKVRASQMSNLVYWTFRKEIPFDAGQMIFDYDVEGDATSPGSSRKVDVTAYTVSHADVDRLVERFESAGLRVEGVMIPSFALRNVLRMQMHTASETSVGLYVGEDSSSILFMHGSQVVAHRVFKTGMNVMIDVLRDRKPDWSAAMALQALSGALAGTDDARLAGSGLKKDEVESMADTVRTSFGRLVLQVERSVSAYLVGRGDEVIKNIFVAGPLASLSPLLQELGSRLGLTCHALHLLRDPLLSGKAPKPDGPETGGLMAVALGAAMSDSDKSPSLLHTYVKREVEAKVNRARSMVTMIGIAAVACMVVGYGYISRINQGMRNELEFQQRQIEKFSPYPDRDMILAMVDEAGADSSALKAMARRNLPVAALNQLAVHTPNDIRLTRVEISGMDSGLSATTPRGRAALPAATVSPDSNERFKLHLDGLVLGEPGLQESKLASYVLRVEDAVMFRKVVLTRTEIGQDAGNQVLLFGMELELEPLASPSLAMAVPAPGVKGGGP